MGGVRPWRQSKETLIRGDDGGWVMGMVVMLLGK